MNEVVIKNADFVTSAKDHVDVLAQLKAGRIKDLSQVAFVGRSNVGKSSLINMLCNRKKMAITSSTPGRTRLINFFNVKMDDKEFYFVDLPGYGFAAASKSAKDGWNENISGYLVRERNLRLVFVILDIRLNPSEKDVMCLHFLQSNGVPFSIIASKADKLSKGEVGRAVSKLAQSLGVGVGDIITTSGTKGTGRASVLRKVDSVV